MSALVIVNWTYTPPDYTNLLYPENDGELMEKMLRDGGYETIVIQNQENIREKVKEYIARQTEHVERFHFHFSGHGKHNATIKIDPYNYVRKLNDCGQFETSYNMKDDSDYYGDCVIGTSGLLYPVLLLKRDLLQVPADTWTVTLDMCRNDGLNPVMRGGPFNQQHTNIQRVEMSSVEPIKDEFLPRVGVVYGTSELHSAHDYHSFTEMLDKVVRENNFSLPFTQISSLVNEAWAEMGIKQKSKTDIVEIGNNWKGYYWPSEITKGEDSEDSLYQELFSQHRLSTASCFSISSSATLMEMIEPILKFVLPREYDHSTSKRGYFYRLSDSMERLANSHFKTAVMLFLDIMKKIENNLLPTKCEINELYIKATEGWNFLKDDNLLEKINMSKIRLFCKYFEVLINEEDKSLKTIDLLEENEKSFLSSFVNMELSRLEELSKKRMSYRKSMKDFQKCIDEVDMIKILSYDEIKKEDYEEEHDGVISKYWTLSSHMVPEGENDALTSQACSFRTDSDPGSASAEFSVFTDFDYNWIVKLGVSGSQSFLPVSLCAIERRNKKVPCIYFPKMVREGSCSSWNLDMKHFTTKKREVTLVFTFAGKLLGGRMNVLSDVSSELRNLVEKNMILIRSINERPYSVYPQYSVSLTLVICNFLSENLWVKPPYFSSGMMDSSHKWGDLVQSFSVSQLFTRKRVLEARGAVGLTVLSTRVKREEVSFLVYWSAPFDFNLYENSFAILPLETDHRDKDCRQIYSEIKNAIHSSSGNKGGSFTGVRGLAKDGPKAFTHRNTWISARMGSAHTDCLQISVIPVEEL